LENLSHSVCKNNNIWQNLYLPRVTTQELINAEHLRSRRIRWAGHVTQVGERRAAYRVLVWKPEGRRQLGRPRYRWEYNIKTNIKSVVRAWTELTWLRVRTSGRLL
jgi:hypothetical protein